MMDIYSQGESGMPVHRVGEYYLDDPDNPIEAAQVWGVETTRRYQELCNVTPNHTYVIVFGCGMGLRPVVLGSSVPAEDIILYEPDPQVRESAKGFFPTYAAQHVITTMAELVKYIDTHTTSRDSLLVASVAAYRHVYPEALGEVEELVHNVTTQLMVREATISQRSRTGLKSILAGILQEIPRGCDIITPKSQPWEGETVFVVAAGPSIDKDLSLLPQLSRKGVVMVVNTSSSVMRQVGADFDVLISLENVDVSSQVYSAATQARQIVLGIGANSNSYSASREAWHVPIVIGSMSPGIRDTCAAYGVPSLYYGASAPTIAISVAVLMGAKQVVLVGQDCAYTDNKFYAEATGRGSWGVEDFVDEGTLKIKVTRDEEFYAQYRERGIPAQPEVMIASRVEANLTGGEVLTSPDLLSTARWITGVARRFCSTIINTSQGGARIAGCTERLLADVLQGLPDRGEYTPIPTERLELRHIDLIGGAQRVQKTLNRYLQGTPGGDMIHQQLVSNPWLTAWVQADIVDARLQGLRGDGLDRARMQHIYDGIPSFIEYVRSIS